MSNIIPSGSYYIQNSEETTSLSLGYNDTNLYIASQTIVPNYFLKKDDRYIKRAIRLSKKQKCSLDDENNPRNRIKGLLKPIVVFKFIKSRFKPIERKELTSRLEKICSILESTSLTNQIALKEKIEEKFGKLIREQEMISCGFDKYFEKQILQEFVNSVKDKAIKITPIKNYTRLIPKDVRDQMGIAKEKMLFDDFVVIHCDPENKSVEKTLEEKKDPILCGIIKQSDRYYFVGDWQDEFCDLTMDTILKALDLDEDDVTLPQDVESALLSVLL